MPAAPVPEELEARMASRLLEILIRAGLLGAMVVLCYRIFSSFLTTMAWAVILAVSMYPLQKRFARTLGGKQGLAATALIVLAILVIVTPTAFLMNSFGDSVRGLVEGVRDGTLTVPPPREGVRNVPVVGEQIHEGWSQAHRDLPTFVQSLQPKIGELLKRALALVAAIGLDLLLFVASLIIAGIVMAHGEAGARGARNIFSRIIGSRKGEKLATLSTATIRTVAQGVLGVAFIQAMVLGLLLLVAGIPWAGMLSLIALLLGIAQVPTLLVAAPAIAYLWMSGRYGTAAAMVFTILLLLAGLIDNVLKPLLLGRGVDAPMPVILLGAIGGMASDGILGMFVGAALLTLGYAIFMDWIAEPPPSPPPT
jgi:predicted PurR-regulated permease PerM